MPLTGTLDTMQLADLMQWIHNSNKTGVLTVTIEVEETYLVFRKGELVAIGSDDPLELDLGQVLLNRGYITEQQLQQAISEAKDSVHLVDVLLRDELITVETISQVQADHVFEAVLDLFFHEQGSFHFSTDSTVHSLLPPPDLPDSNFLRQPISTQQLILAGMQRLDEWNQIRQVFPNSYVLVHALEGDASNTAWKLLSESNMPMAVGELCLRMGGSRFRAYQLLYEAYNLGMIGLDLMPVGRVGQTHLGPIEMLIQNARILIEESQFVEAKTVLTTASNLDPSNEEAHKLLRKTRELELEQLYQQIPPHRIPKLAVDQSQLDQFQLTPRETYLASRLRGRWDVATLVVGTPLGELETLRILAKFHHAGIMKFVE